MTESDILSVFMNQMNFDIEATRRNVKSLIHYNRYSCSRILAESKNIVEDICKGCVLNEDKNRY